ncbi:hypothetical protein J2X10_003548 [Pseudomonas peli]|nr:hypothetical protein [Pseudomonas peli]
MCVGTLLLNSCQLDCKKLTNWTISAARRVKTQNPAEAGFCGGAVLVRQVLLVLPAGAWGSVPRLPGLAQ